MSFEGLEQQFAANGYYTFLAELKTIFLIFGDESVFVFKLLTFLSYFFSGLFLYLILRNIREIGSTARLFIVLFFITFPVNSAKISLVIVNHSINHFLFFFVLWLFTIFLKKRSIIVRIVSLSLFFFFFYSLFISILYYNHIYLLYFNKDSIWNVKNLIKIVAKHTVFFILPILYWVFKNNVFVTTGLYKEYNEIGPIKLTSLFKNILDSFDYSFIEVIKWSIPNTIMEWLFMFIILLLLITFIKIKSKPTIGLPIFIRNLFFIVLGVVVFIAGTYAYLAVGKMPMLNDWNSRQQILVPLGASLILYYFLSLIFDIFHLQSKVRVCIFSVLVSMFIVTNIGVYYDFEKGWLKQKSLMEHFGDAEIFEENTTFIFDDQILYLNANNRIYRFYEYTGMFKKVFGETRRLGQSKAIKIDMYRMNKLKHFLYFNINNYEMSEEKYIVVKEGSYKLNFPNYLKLKFNSVFNKDIYKENVKDILMLETESISK
ncbi:hypothetical protein [Gracilibacillus kekensis]|uniref:Glycosyltransferase RgtA/B/C/D-like domain-containing protein n=1 Tax=Gracilibacillus kekensis TaxID=1027249 RepID=A0A1M7K7G0_9BACI|nr:hypothetical protein [Gracilibacillus kekensis]SHM60767.1 hypothetical protein SAMN05216179_0592 [Gracilibacillus kekensis]